MRGLVLKAFMQFTYLYVQASQKILQLGRSSPAAAAGPHGAEEGDPASSFMTMIFPSIATKLDITLITLSLGLARYRDSGRSTIQSIVEVICCMSSMFHIKDSRVTYVIISCNRRQARPRNLLPVKDITIQHVVSFWSYR